MRSKLILILLFLTGCSQYNFWDYTDLGFYQTNFDRVFSNRENIEGMKTKGFYYSIDSALYYKFDSFMGIVYREKKFITNNMPPNFKLLDSVKAYYLSNLIWVNEDGTVYYPWENDHPYDMESKNVYDLEKNPLMPLDKISDKIISRFISELSGRKNSGRIYNCQKGLMQNNNKRLKLFFYQCQFEMPDALKNKDGVIVNDSVIAFFREQYFGTFLGKDSTGGNIITWEFGDVEVDFLNYYKTDFEYEVEFINH